jgi:hypothetical protein
MMRDLLSDHPFEVDAVITWVDGSDPDWLERKQKFLGPKLHASVAVDGASQQRWLDQDTLRFVLRSIDRFMPWIRHIHLVTDGQKPSWLKTGDKVRVVHHEDFFASHVALPTFNSQVIESQLHLVPGLSEHFIYFNDDVILTRSAKISDYFFANGICKFYPGKHESRRLGKYVPGVSTNAAFSNLQSLMKGKAWAEIARRCKHQPFALRRSVLDEMSIMYRGAYETLGQHRFRSLNDVAPTSQLFQYHAFVDCKAVPAHDWFWYYNADPVLSWRFWRNLLTMRLQLCVCVNSASQNAGQMDASYRMLMAELGAMFRKKPDWELQ